jgi:hypothetical protein
MTEPTPPVDAEPSLSVALTAPVQTPKIDYGFDPFNAVLRRAKRWSDEWFAIVVRTERELNHPVCGTPGTKRDNPTKVVPCTLYPMKGRDRCQRHGGKNKGGADNPNFRHGKNIGDYALQYKKKPEGPLHRSLPSTLADVYAEFIDDPTLTTLRDQLALLKAAQAEMVLVAKNGEGQREHWLTVQRIVRDYQQTNGGNAKANKDFMDALVVVVPAANTAGLNGATLLKLSEQIRKLAETEQKHADNAQTMVPINKIIALFQAALLIIGEELNKLLDPTSSERLQKLLNMKLSQIITKQIGRKR